MAGVVVLSEFLEWIFDVWLDLAVVTGETSGVTCWRDGSEGHRV
jgi:hypothetical protein